MSRELGHLAMAFLILILVAHQAAMQSRTVELNIVIVIETEMVKVMVMDTCRTAVDMVE